MRRAYIYEGIVHEDDDAYPSEKIGNDSIPDIIREFKDQKIRITIEILDDE